MTEINLEAIKETINPSFYPLMSEKSRYLISVGGAGSGKSVSLVAQKTILRCLFADQKGITHRILCLRKTLPDVRRSVFSLIKHYVHKWNLESIIKINKTDMTFYFKNGSEILCTGLDDPEKLKSIHGLTSIVLEEATSFTKDDFTQCDLRLRGEGISDYFQIVMCFNPISKTNWIYKEFFEDEAKKAEYEALGITKHHSTYRDNIFLDEIYKSKLESYENISPYIYKVYCLGEWGILSGLIYENFELIEPDHPDIPKTVPVYGLDFGFNHPTALVEIRKRVRENKIFVKEMLYETGWTNAQLIRWIKTNLKPSNLIVCDNAEPSRIKELQSEGIKAMPCRKGQNSVFDGIDYLKRHEIKIIKPSNNLYNEITGYCWKTDKNNTPLDEPISINDDCMAAMRYPCWTKWGYTQSTPSIVWL